MSDFDDSDQMSGLAPSPRRQSEDIALYERAKEGLNRLNATAAALLSDATRFSAKADEYAKSIAGALEKAVRAWIETFGAGKSPAASNRTDATQALSASSLLAASLATPLHVFVVNLGSSGLNEAVQKGPKSEAGGIDLTKVVLKLVPDIVKGSLVPTLVEVNKLLDGVHRLLLQTTVTITSVIGKVFLELEHAGIFPVAKLFDMITKKLTTFIDEAITLAIKRINPYLTWLTGTLAGAFGFLNQFFGALSAWFGHLLNRLPAFFADMIRFVTLTLEFAVKRIVQEVVQPLIRQLLGALVLLSTALVEGLAAFGRWFKESLKNPFGDTGDPGKLAIAAMLRAVTDPGNRLTAATTAAALLLPDKSPKSTPSEDVAEAVKDARRRRGKGGVTASRETGTRRWFIGQPEIIVGRPYDRFVPPSFGAPKLDLPALPGEEGASPPAAPGTSALVPTPAAARKALEPSSIVFNGGIHVDVRAERVDLEHAPAIAGLIVDKLRYELGRLNEQERMRRGLSTGTLE